MPNRTPSRKEQDAQVMTDYTVGTKQNEIVGRVHSGLQVVSSSAFTFLTFSNIYQL